MSDAIGIWVLLPGQNIGAVARAAMDGKVPPDLSAAILSSNGDVLGVQLAGPVPHLVGFLVYVQHHGGFKVLRQEVWPPAKAGGSPRVLLTLMA